MDFNTGGSGGRPDDQSRPLYVGEAGGPPSGPPREPAGSPGGEFNLQDPVGSFTNAARSVALQPSGFFRGMVRQGDWIGPIVFALVCYEIFIILGGIIGLAFGSIASFGTGDTGEQAAGVAASLGGFVVSLVVAPIIAAIILFVMAGIRHLLVILLVGSGNAGFEATMRVQAYSFTTRLIWWIPVLGSIVGFFYGLFLSVVGIREVHTTTTGKAALVVLIPVVVVLILLLLFAALIGAAIFTLLEQQQL